MTSPMMNVPENELFSAYVDGELTAAEQAEVERLLAASPAARQLVEDLRALSSTVQSLPVQKLDHDLSHEVLRLAERRVLSGQTDGDASESDFQSGTGRWRRIARRLSRPRTWVWPSLAVAVSLLLVVLQPRPVEKAAPAPARGPVALAPAPGERSEPLSIGALGGGEDRQSKDSQIGPAAEFARNRDSRSPAEAVRRMAEKSKSELTTAEKPLAAEVSSARMGRAVKAAALPGRPGAPALPSPPTPAASAIKSAPPESALLAAPEAPAALPSSPVPPAGPMKAAARAASPMKAAPPAELRMANVGGVAAEAAAADEITIVVCDVAAEGIAFVEQALARREISVSASSRDRRGGFDLASRAAAIKRDAIDETEREKAAEKSGDKRPAKDFATVVYLDAEAGTKQLDEILADLRSRPDLVRSLTLSRSAAAMFDEALGWLLPKGPLGDVKRKAPLDAEKQKAKPPEAASQPALREKAKERVQLAEQTAVARQAVGPDAAGPDGGPTAKRRVVFVLRPTAKSSSGQEFASPGDKPSKRPDAPAIESPATTPAAKAATKTATDAKSP